MSIDGIGNQNISIERYRAGEPKQYSFVKFGNVEDSFELQKKDASNDGKFTFGEALKNFGKGLISPLKAVVKHPIMSIGAIAVTAVGCSLIPVLAPILAVGFGALSLFQLGKGVYNAVSQYKKGNYDASEKAFEDIGAGTVGTATSALGIRQSAKIALEAKTMSELNVATLNAEQKAQIAQKISSGSWFNALKENVTLLTTKSGLKATFNQFRPTMIKARFVDFQNKRAKKMDEKEVQRKLTREEKLKAIEDFKKSPEGIRRANLTDEQISKEAEQFFNNAFDELKVPKEYRPKFEQIKGDAQHGGSYNSTSHSIEYNPESYKSGIFEIDDVIMHEATHCKEAILRSGLPDDLASSVVKDALKDRIINGESEQIIQSGGFLGPKMMKSPNLPTKMKAEFAQYADDMLYTNDSGFRNALSEFSDKSGIPSDKIKPAIERLQSMMADNPDFVAQYDNSDQALKALVDYSLSHTIRYNAFADNKIVVRGSSYWSSDSKVISPSLTPEETQAAIKSLQENITSIEGNGRISGFNGWFAGEDAFNQYQFSPEEVLAQQNGNKFFMKNMASKMEEMRKAGTLTPEKEQQITQAIQKAQQVIDFKTKGLKYYEAYTKLLNNPGDDALKATVAKLAEELKAVDPDVITVIEKTYPTYISKQVMTPVYAVLNQVGSN